MADVVSAASASGEIENNDGSPALHQPNQQPRRYRCKDCGEEFTERAGAVRHARVCLKKDSAKPQDDSTQLVSSTSGEMLQPQQQQQQQQPSLPRAPTPVTATGSPKHFGPNVQTRSKSACAKQRQSGATVSPPKRPLTRHSTCKLNLRPKASAAGYQCTKCPYKVAFRHVMLKHIDTAHSSVQKHTCKLNGCSASFSSRAGLARHQHWVHVRQDKENQQRVAVGINKKFAELKRSKLLKLRTRRRKPTTVPPPHSKVSQKQQAASSIQTAGPTQVEEDTDDEMEDIEVAIETCTKKSQDIAASAGNGVRTYFQIKHWQPAAAPKNRQVPAALITIKQEEVEDVEQVTDALDEAISAVLQTQSHIQLPPPPPPPPPVPKPQQQHKLPASVGGSNNNVAGSVSDACRPSLLEVMNIVNSCIALIKRAQRRRPSTVIGKHHIDNNADDADDEHDAIIVLFVRDLEADWRLGMRSLVMEAHDYVERAFKQKVTASSSGSAAFPMLSDSGGSDQALFSLKTLNEFRNHFMTLQSVCQAFLLGSGGPTVTIPMELLELLRRLIDQVHRAL